MSDDQGPWTPRPPSTPPRRAGVAPWLLAFAVLAGLAWALARAFPEALQTGDDWASAAYALILAMVVCGGLARFARRNWARSLRYAAIWVAVAAVLAVAFAFREDVSGVGRRLQLAFSAGDPVETGERQITIPQDESGAFTVVARVNGARVVFLVDTGATGTVLSPADARRLGVDTEGLAYDYAAETANGTGYGAAFTAKRLEVGPLVLADMPMTINQAPMSASLLGLDFLHRLESFEVRDRRLTLRWRQATP